MRPTSRPLVAALALALSLPHYCAAQEPDPLLPCPPVASRPEPLGGCFAAAEFAVLRPRVEQYPSDLYTGVRLAVTVSPELSAGYRFASGRALHLDYRFLASSGSQSYYPRLHPEALGPGDVPVYLERPYTGRAELDLHVADLDFTFRDPPWRLLPFVRSRWEVGARGAVLWADVREPRIFDDRSGWGRVGAEEWFGDERATTHFRGLGPHFDYRLAAAIDSWGLEFFARSDLGLLFGTRTTRYAPVGPQPWRDGRPVGPDSAGNLVDARPISEHRFSRAAWNWRGDLGARLALPWRSKVVTLTAGYRADFWTIGGDSSGGGGFGSFWAGQIKVPDFDLDSRGVFLQVEVPF